ncbi:MAG TPA: AAA family ATPase [Smithellaceae bacterium]|nr:AAA family ATPase [Smithellaceae bacterium]
MSNFHKSQRSKGKLRLAIAGPAGSGKTYSALQIAFGIGGRIAMIDTERGSGELYSHLGNYDACTVTSPFEPAKYVAAILEAEKLGYDVIIIDSLTHAWAGQGGLLDLHGKIADRGGNSWAAWRKVTPQHNELVDAMIQSSCHIIATMRSKMEYAQSEDGGKKTVKKLGMAPIQREGLEYEFTVFLDIDLNHTAVSSKDRTSLFDGKYFIPTPETGKILINWLNNAPDAEQKPAEPPTTAPATKTAKTTPSTRPADKTAGTSKPENKVIPESSGQRVPDNHQATNLNATRADGNRYAPLLAVAQALNLSVENYKQYCRQRYGLQSLNELTDGQIAEQVKLLDSLHRPERLKAFLDILKTIDNDRPAAHVAQNVAVAGHIPTEIAHTVQ